MFQINYNMLDKLLKSNGWSSKKFAGLESLQLAFISAMIYPEQVGIVIALLTYSAAALGIDAYNKTQQLNKK